MYCSRQTLNVHLRQREKEERETDFNLSDLRSYYFVFRLEFSMSPTDIKRKQLNITVKNQTGFLSSEKVLMGQVIVNLSELDLSQPVTNW